MTPQERRIRELAKKLHGGWRMDNPLVPVVVLTAPEAEAIVQQIERGRDRFDGLLAVKAKVDGKEIIYSPRDIQFIVQEDGM